MKRKFLITVCFVLSTAFCLAQQSSINNFINEYKLNGKANIQSFDGTTLSNQLVAGMPDSAKIKYHDFLSQIVSAVQKLDSVHIIDDFKDTGIARQTIFQGLKNELSANNYTDMFDVKITNLGKITLMEKEGNKNSVNDFVFFIGEGTVGHAHGIIAIKDIENMVAALKKEMPSAKN